MANQGGAVSSNACLGVAVEFYWIDAGDRTGDQHIDQAVAALFGVIEGDGRRLWNPYAMAMVKGEFRARLQKASEGKLQPFDEIKGLRGGNLLFEIRWSGINIRQKKHGTDLEEYHRVEVRLIHAQPYEQLGLCLLGLHAHEKIIVDGDSKATKMWQDFEIDEAERLYHAGRPYCWGVKRRI